MIRLLETCTLGRVSIVGSLRRCKGSEAMRNARSVVKGSNLERYVTSVGARWCGIVTMRLDDVDGEAGGEEKGQTRGHGGTDVGERTPTGSCEPVLLYRLAVGRRQQQQQQQHSYMAVIVARPSLLSRQRTCRQPTPPFPRAEHSLSRRLVCYLPTAAPASAMLDLRLWRD